MKPRKTMHPAGEKSRLDQLLASRQLFESRARARDAILRGTVFVDGAICKKPGTVTSGDAEIRIDDPARHYVSRAALKLVAGLDHFGFDPRGRTVLDIGASTGGFTQVLLENGVNHVVAVDVGHDQLHPALRENSRVTSLEGVNARDLTAETIGSRPVHAVVSDVSFISLKLALPPALAIAEPGSFCLLLVKPQFEAGRPAIGKGGILKNPDDGPRIAKELSEWLGNQPGWASLGYCPTPIKGGDGNAEFLLGGTKS